MNSLKSDPLTLFCALFFAQLLVELCHVLSINTMTLIDGLTNQADLIMDAALARHFPL